MNKKKILPCNICKTSRYASCLYFLRKFDVVKCNKCGLVYINIPFKEKKLTKEYASEIYITNKGVYFRRFRENLKFMGKVYPKKGKLLDIGCGLGYFLSTAKKNGWDVYGCDLSESAITYSKKIFNLKKTYQCDIDKLNFSNGFFDVITMWNVVEHLANPQKTLVRLNRYLKKDGILVIETPTEEGIFKIIGNLLYKISYGKFILPLQLMYSPFGHHYSFSKKSLNLILKKAHFKVIKIKKTQTPFMISLRGINSHKALSKFRTINWFWFVFIFLMAKLTGKLNRIIVIVKKC